MDNDDSDKDISDPLYKGSTGRETEVVKESGKEPATPVDGTNNSAGDSKVAVDFNLANSEEEQRRSQTDTIQNNEGLFTLYTLIPELPRDYEYTCCEAYEQNIYLGTSTGDLLHYFEIEPATYMLVSNTKFDAESNFSIECFVLLPEIERALVLCNNKLVEFLLPEFAPSPNTPNFLNVCDVAIRNYSAKKQNYYVFIFQKDSINLLSISKMATHTVRTFDFEMVDCASAHGSLLLLSQSNNYKLVNLHDDSVTPLFYVSEGGDSQLKPIIRSFSSSNFLIASGGNTTESQAIALILNHKGDITHNTVLLDEYPADIIISKPFLFINYGHRNVIILKLAADGEVQVIQHIKNENYLNICKSTGIFTHLRDTQLNKNIVEVLSYTCILGESSNEIIEARKEKVQQAVKLRTNLIAYGGTGVQLLVKEPDLLAMSKKRGKEDIPTIRNYLKKPASSSRYRDLEKSFLSTQALLMQIYSERELTKESILQWCLQLETVDIQLLFYVLGWDVYSTVYVENGLVNFLDEIRDSKPLQKCRNEEEIIMLLSNELHSRSDKGSIKNLGAAIRTVDMQRFKIDYQNAPQNIDIEKYSNDSLNDIIEFLKHLQTPDNEILLQIYERSNMILEAFELLKQKHDSHNSLRFISAHAKKISTQYPVDKLETDMYKIIKDIPNIDKNMIQEVLKILEAASIDPSTFIKGIKSNVRTKVLFMEEMRVFTENDKEFLLDFYMTELEAVLDNRDIWEKITEFLVEYTQDTNYKKPSVYEYLEIKLTYDEDCRKLRDQCENLKRILKEDDSFSERILSALGQLDVGHVLSLLIVQGQISKYMADDVLLDWLLAYNDFKSIDKIVNGDNFLKVLEHYQSLNIDILSSLLVKQFLEHHLHLMDNTITLSAVLDKISSKHQVFVLEDALLRIFSKLDLQKKQLEMQKAILKSELSIHDRILQTLGERKKK